MIPTDTSKSLTGKVLVQGERESWGLQLMVMLMCHIKADGPCSTLVSANMQEKQTVHCQIFQFFQKSFKKSEFPYDTSRFLKHVEAYFCNSYQPDGQLLLYSFKEVAWHLCSYMEGTPTIPESLAGSCLQCQASPRAGQKLHPCFLHNPSKAPREH